MNIKKMLLIFFAVMILIFNIAPVLAEDKSDFANSDINYLKTEAESLKQTNLGNPNLLAGSIVKLIVSVSGAVALLMVVYGGFIWMTAAGSAEKISKAQKMIFWALLGLVALFSAYMILSIILNFASTGNAVYTLPSSK